MTKHPTDEHAPAQTRELLAYCDAHVDCELCDRLARLFVDIDRAAHNAMTCSPDKDGALQAMEGLRASYPWGLEPDDEASDLLDQVAAEVLKGRW